MLQTYIFPFLTSHIVQKKLLPRNLYYDSMLMYILDLFSYILSKLRNNLTYHTGAIISCGLYIFFPIFKDHFFVFKEFFSENSVLMYGLYSRAAYDGACTVGWATSVPFALITWFSWTRSSNFYKTSKKIYIFSPWNLDSNYGTKFTWLHCFLANSLLCPLICYKVYVNFMNNIGNVCVKFYINASCCLGNCHSI